VTIDFDTADDGRATVRDRDTMGQERVPLEGVAAWVAERVDPGS
jgi:glycyl-tRNA synthetase